MKKILLAFSALLLTFGYVGAQNLVSTTAENKKVILEEFTGINCVNCPQGKVVAEQMKTANPNDVFVVGMHPTNSSYTNGTPDFRRGYLDAFYSTPWVGTSRFMPSAMINRREWTAGEKISSRSIWASSGSTIMGEPSPVNVGLEATYDAAKDTIAINVEVYFTGAVTDAMTLYVMMTEDSIIGYQSGGSANYQHDYVFREPFCAQWGDPISNTNAMDLNKYSFSFPAASASGYKLDYLNIVAYVKNSANDEIVSGNGAPVIEGIITSTSPEAAPSTFDMQVAPNPFSGITTVNYYLDIPSAVEVTMVDLMGKTVYNVPTQAGQRGKNTFTLDASSAGLSTGVYLLQLRSGDQKITKKVVLN